MVEVVQFESEHLAELELQDAQYYLRPVLANKDYADSLKHSGPAYTVLDGGKPVACIGVVEYHPGRAQAWALMGFDARKNLFAITRRVKQWLDSTKYARIETTVDGPFKQGHRWAKMLGFECETPAGMKRYAPNGLPAYLYGRIK